jgi:hypothetical protein
MHHDSLSMVHIFLLARTPCSHNFTLFRKLRLLTRHAHAWRTLACARAHLRTRQRANKQTNQPSALGGEQKVVAAYEKELAENADLAAMPGPHTRYGVLQSFMIWQEAANHGDQVFLVRDWTEEFGGAQVTTRPPDTRTQAHVSLSISVSHHSFALPPSLFTHRVFRVALFLTHRRFSLHYRHTALRKGLECRNRTHAREH